MNKRTLLFFERKVFEQYGQSKQFEKCRKYLLNILESMTNEIDWFSSLSNEKKYQICEVSALITIQSERESMNAVQVISKPEPLQTKFGINRENPKFDLREIEIKPTQKMIPVGRYIKKIVE